MRDKDVQTLWEVPPPSSRKVAYAKWFYRTAESRARELIEQAKKTKEEDVCYYTNKHMQAVPDRLLSHQTGFLEMHIERCKRMQKCLETYGMICLGRGVTVDVDGRPTKGVTRPHHHSQGTP